MQTKETQGIKRVSEQKQTPPPGERIWNFLASVKLSFALFLALALSSVLGTLIPQKESLSVYVQEYGEAGARLIQTLRLNDMYHAPWFLLILACLAANLVICSANRLPTTLKLMAKDPQADLKRSTPAQETLSLEGPPAEHAQRVQALLAQTVGPVTRGETKGGGVLLFAQSGAWSRLGVYLVHASVLIIMGGAIIGNIWGFSGHMNISEGESQEAIVGDNGQRLPLGFAVRLDKFAVSFYQDGMPSEYRSDVVFLDQGKESQKAILRVNEPAAHQGVDFYQASYGQNVQSLVLDVVRQGQGQPQRVALEHGKWTDLKGGGQLLLLEARPDITMGDIYSGPAARIGYQEPGAEPLALTAFKAGAPFPSRGPVRLEIVDLKTVPYSGLSVKYDPGVWLIWVGCVLMVLGFVVTFYCAHRKVWVRLLPAGKNGSKLEVAGSTNKNRLALKRLNQRLAARIGRP